MPATATPAQKFAAMPLLGYFVNELGLEPRDALRRARAIFSELAPDVIERANAAIMAHDAKAWAEAVDPAWDGAAQVFAEAAKAGTFALEHSHMHTHPGGTLHAHMHTHPAGTEAHGHGADVAHRHDHADPVMTSKTERKPTTPHVPTFNPGAPVLDAGRPEVALASEPDLIAAARAHQQKVFSETGQAPDSILPGRRGEKDRVVNTFGDALKFVSKTASVTARKDSGLSNSELVLEKVKAFQARRFSETGIRPDDPANELGDALKAISLGEASTIPGTSVQKTMLGRNDGTSFKTPEQKPWAWDEKSKSWQPTARPVDQLKARLLGKPLQDRPEAITYSEAKRQALGKLATAQPSRAEAREAALRLGEKLKASEEAPKVVLDNADVVQAAEAYMAERFAKFGERVPLKKAILEVGRRKR
jgi:hypothetical protein